MPEAESKPVDSVQLLANEVGRLGAAVEGIKHSQNVLIGAVAIGFATLTGYMFYDGNRTETRLQAIEGHVRQLGQDTAIIKNDVQRVLVNTAAARSTL